MVLHWCFDLRIGVLTANTAHDLVTEAGGWSFGPYKMRYIFTSFKWHDFQVSCPAALLVPPAPVLDNSPFNGAFKMWKVIIHTERRLHVFPQVN